MGKQLAILILTIMLLITFNYRKDITKFIESKITEKKEVKELEKNKYYKELNYESVKNETNLITENKEQTYNIIYTILNSGNSEFTFFCSDAYENCQTDINEIANDSVKLSYINNLVHPFNSYSNIYFTFNNYGKITVKIDKLYSPSEINQINKKVDSIIANNIKDSTSDEEKIKIIHDYIINTTKYNSNITMENIDINNPQNKATGVLFEGYSVCSGYSDAFAIFMHKLNIDNYKINSSTHIWNMVKVNGEWKHIDLTWDDPITSNNTNIITHDYFLINTQELIEKDNKIESDGHEFNRNLYKEVK